MNVKEYQLNNNHKIYIQLNKIIDNINSNEIQFPYKYFEILSEESAKIVKEAKNGDIDKQFEVGRNLIEGRYDFPIDVSTGISFLINSMNKGKKESLIYYIEMMIKGEIIPKNSKKVRKLINEKLSEDESTHLLLEGKLLKKEKKIFRSS